MKTLSELDLVVFDMAGTTVAEGGVVYDTLERVLRDAGATFTEEAFGAWHGANKIEVLRHFLGHRGEAEVQGLFERFLTDVEAAYFAPDSPVRPIEGIEACFRRLREAGVRVALNTGYPRYVAERLVERLGFGPRIDDLVVSEEVGAGRPRPYMIHALVKRLDLEDVRRVAKVGDTVRDVEEGLNAGCGLVVGVLTGADPRRRLEGAGAHLVLDSAAHLAEALA